jgi:hypothetical protein
MSFKKQPLNQKAQKFSRQLFQKKSFKGFVDGSWMVRGWFVDGF